MAKRENNRLGQGLAEYALILSLIAVVAVAALALLGSGTKQAFCSTLIGINVQMAADCIPEPEEADPDDVGNTELQALSAIRSTTGELIVLAKIPEGSTVSLSLAGYGPMQRVGETNLFIFRTSVHDSPGTVTIVASDGSTLTINVHQR